MRRLGAGAHEDDHALGLRDGRRSRRGGSGRPVRAAKRSITPCDDARAGGVEARCGLAGLEEGVRVLGGAAEDGTVGGQARGRGARATASSSTIRPRRSSSVSSSIFATSCEVRKPSKKCRKGTRDARVAAWATAARSCASWTEPEDSSAKPGLAAGHDVGVVAEDREGVGGDGAGGHVHAEGGQLARDLVHVRDHQEQALRGGEGRGQGARLERAVDGPAAPPPTASPMTSGTAPQRFVRPCADHASRQLAHRSRRG